MVIKFKFKYVLMVTFNDQILLFVPKIKKRKIE